MQYTLSYVSYLLISIFMTVWVAHTLSKNGIVFLVRCFGQDEELAKSTNHLLVVGFYLINLGLIGIRLEGWHLTTQNALPYVGSKIGTTILLLGAMHFFNMIMISKFGNTVSLWMNRNRMIAQMPPIPGNTSQMPPIPVASTDWFNKP